MKISFVLSSLYLSGGVKAIIEISNRLVTRGHQVVLIIPGGTRDAGLVTILDPAIVVKESRIQSGSYTNPLKLISLGFSLALAVPQSDIVISTHTPTTFSVLIATYFLRRGLPIWYFLDYPEMFVNRPIEGWLLRHALFWHRGALTISEFCRQVLLDTKINRPVINISIGLMNSGLAPDSQKKDKDERSWMNKKPVLFLGDDRPRKGFLDFIMAAEKAFQEEPEIILWIVSKVKLTVPSELPYHLFLRPSDQELMELYQNCAVFVSASWIEGFGLPPLEAMANGAPVVLTDSQGVQDYAKPYENCILVPPRSPKALAEGIVKVLRDSELANRFRQNGPITAANFKWESTIDKFERALCKWLKI